MSCSRIHSTSRRLIVTVALSLATLGVAGPASALVATTPADTGAAPATDVPVTTPDTVGPPDTATPDTVAPDNGGDDIDWLPIGIAIGLGVLLLIIVVALFSRRSPSQPATAPRATTNPQSNLLSTAQWVHDQLSLELLAAAPAVAAQRWSVERSRLDNIAIGAQQQWSEGHGDGWQRLGQTVSQLANSLDTSTQLRNQDPPDAQLVQQANDVVNRHRAELQAMLTALWPTVRR